MRTLIIYFLCISFVFASKIEYEKSINVVTDHTNQIIWQDDSEVIDYKENYTTSQVYCDTLILNGYIDWRVPTIKELQKIIDLKNKNYINSYFKFVNPEYYNTITGFKGDEISHWVIDFKSGKTLTDLKKNLKYVRCVRDIR